MPVSRKAIARLLSDDEREMVDRTGTASMRQAGDRDLVELRRNIRERRDRARRMASQQRREMRGKGAARGASPARDAAGTEGKFDVLTSALKRLGKEITRREKAARPSQQTLSERALALKEAGASPSTQPDDRTADEGMRNIPAEGQPPSGAFDHAGMMPAMQRSKFARQ